MNKKIMLIFLLLNFFINFLFAQENKEFISYFPLKVGNYWLLKYGKTSSIEKRIIDYSKETDTYLMLVSNKLGDLEPIKSYEVYKLYCSDLFLVSRILISDTEPKPLLPARIILKYPLKKGLKWSEYINDEEKKVNLIVDFTSCKVAASYFNNVCKIKSTVIYETDVGIDSLCTYNYYAPNIGLIRQDVLDKNGTSKTLYNLINYSMEK